MPANRLHGVKHGLSVETLVLPGESQSEFTELLDSFEAEYRPITPTEVMLVRQMVMASWRLCRLYHIEAAFFAYELDDQKEFRDKYHEGLDDHGKLAYMVRRTDPARTLSNLSRYEARLERSFRTALQDLRRLRKQAQTAPLAEAPQIGFALPKIEQVPPAARRNATEPPCASMSFTPPLESLSPSPSKETSLRSGRIEQSSPWPSPPAARARATAL